MKLFLFFLTNFCKNCVFFETSPYDIRLQRTVCLKFNGKITEICREDESKCGMEGKFYKEKDTANTEQILSCKGCKFYEPSFHRCKAFQKTNLVTGMSTLEYVELCRRDETKCGKYGKYFTPYTMNPY